MIGGYNFGFSAKPNSGGGGGGTVDSVVQGSNITVNNTDPANPIVNVSDNVSLTGTITASNLRGTNTGNETVNTLGALINGAASATPNDTDLVMSVDASVAKKNTWTQIKAFLKTYFDTIYTTTSAVATQISTALTGYLTSATAASTYAPLASPTFSGTVGVPTLSPDNNSDTAASTAYVDRNNFILMDHLAFSPSDGVVIFWGSRAGTGPVATDIQPLSVDKGGVIYAAIITTSVSSTLGSTEDSTVAVGVAGVYTNLSTTVKYNTRSNCYKVSGLSIAFSANDIISSKETFASFFTNPVGVTTRVVLYVRYSS